MSLIGRAIEGMIQEQEEYQDGDEKKWRFKYQLEELLDDSNVVDRDNKALIVKTPATLATAAGVTSTGYVDSKIFRNTRGSIIVDSV